MGLDPQKLLDDAKKTPIQQIDDYTRDIFAADSSARQRIVAGERVAVATLITSMAVVATGGFVIALPLAFVPFLMPLVGAVAGFAVDEINDLLSNFGLHRTGICDHPELQPKTMDDGTWLHYPGRNYNGRRFGAVPGNPLKGWGALGLETVTPDLRDYPQIEALNIDFSVDRRVLKIPDAAAGSFWEAWYAVYAAIKEINYLQQCSALSSESADQQEEASLLSFLTLWNRGHTNASTTTLAAVQNPGDDRTLVKHTTAITINTGEPLKPSASYTRSGRALVLALNAPPVAPVATKDGLSTGAKIGVGVGAVAGIAVAATAVHAVQTGQTFGDVWRSIWHVVKNSVTPKRDE